jgi:hypothetical protein
MPNTICTVYRRPGLIPLSLRGAVPRREAMLAARLLSSATWVTLPLSHLMVLLQAWSGAARSRRSSILPVLTRPAAMALPTCPSMTRGHDHLAVWASAQDAAADAGRSAE